MRSFIRTAKDARAAIGMKVEWFDRNGSHRSGRVTDAFGWDVKIDYGAWMTRRGMADLKLHRMYATND